MRLSPCLDRVTLSGKRACSKPSLTHHSVREAHANVYSPLGRGGIAVGKYGAPPECFTLGRIEYEVNGLAGDLPSNLVDMGLG